ncbi:MAG: glycosyltransferase [Thermogemmatispora sp.]|uniref:glycosyltransferase n=1 Tax=Thermogemmatispora sp. TaxID=1968838 RepID=UPI0026115CDF|nr:glycosyltransferase [Thermogemmatispora sp.]MBX5458500.1 glycosyltransferase [Thermogemmatispora sp.]
MSRRLLWMARLALGALSGGQLVLALRVICRWLRTAGGQRLEPASSSPHSRTDEQASVAVLLPVLNERQRLAPCLEGLLTQGPEVGLILVSDGGSDDGTRELVCAYAQRDRRLRLLDAAPIPDGWNGKVWGLEAGWRALPPTFPWVLTIDADVRPAPGLVAALLARARRDRLAALSLAVEQDLPPAPLLGLLHPSLLTSLVYRYGMPGSVYEGPGAGLHVQANGQCFLVEREALAGGGGFAPLRHSLCEDVTLARLLARAGRRLAFVEGGPLASVEMYRTAGEAWQNWTRSLPLHDHLSPAWHTLLGWLEVLLVQALPLPLLSLLAGALLARGKRWRRAALPLPVAALGLNAGLLLLRLGALVGMRRAYRRTPWTYWLSPLCDLAVALQLGRQALRRRHRWRGRLVIRGNAPGGIA